MNAMELDNYVITFAMNVIVLLEDYTVHLVDNFDMDDPQCLRNVGEYRLYTFQCELEEEDCFDEINSKVDFATKLLQCEINCETGYGLDVYGCKCCGRTFIYITIGVAG